MKKFRCIVHVQTTEEARKHGMENEYSGVTVFIVMPDDATAERNHIEIKAEAIKTILQEVKIDNDWNVYRLYTENIKIQSIMNEEEYQKETADFLREIEAVWRRN